MDDNGSVGRKRRKTIVWKWHNGNAFYVTYQSSRISHTRLHSSIHSSAFGICCSPTSTSSCSSFFFLDIIFHFFIFNRNERIYVAVWLLSFYLCCALQMEPRDDIFIARLYIVFLFRPTTTKKMRTLKSYICRSRQCVCVLLFSFVFICVSRAHHRWDGIKRKLLWNSEETECGARVRVCVWQSHALTVRRDAVTILFYRHIVARRCTAMPLPLFGIESKLFQLKRSHKQFIIFFSLLLFRISMPLFARHARMKVSRNLKKKKQKKNAQRMVQMAKHRKKKRKKYKWVDIESSRTLAFNTNSSV